MFANSNKLQLSYFGLNFTWIFFKFAFLNSSVSHSGRKDSEIKISHISFISLEVRIVFEEPIKFVTSRLPFEKDVVAMSFEFFLYFAGDRIGKDSFSSTKLNINEIRSNQFILISLLGNELGL